MPPADVLGRVVLTLHGAGAAVRFLRTPLGALCLDGESVHADHAVRAGQAFSFECYYRRTRAKTSGQECFFIVADAKNTVHVRFFRTAEGFKMWENLNSVGDLPDTLIPGTSDGDLLPDTWYHVALVHTIEDRTDAGHARPRRGRAYSRSPGRDRRERSARRLGSR